MEDDVPLMAFQTSLQAAADYRVVNADTPRSVHYKYASNAVSHAKYNLITFLPSILYEQFKFFFNLYFLLVALSQAYPPLRIGYLSSYIVPLAFVLSITMGKEAYDDLLRRKRDNEANSEYYSLSNGFKKRAMDLKVGDIVTLHINQRVPADIVILRSSESNGESFIRTDQLDGETDWKLRQACTLTQSLAESMGLSAYEDVNIMCGLPEKSISQFQGTCSVNGREVPLTVDNTMWANTVVAAGTIEGMVVYTGSDTRMALNTNSTRSKVSLLELEVNNISKFLCASVFLLSIILVCFQGFTDKWYLQVLRFLILFSTIIPVSLRVNLDMAKSFYAYQIEHDRSIPQTVVRTSTIPEDLGRIDYLLTDKTGTITQNDMDLRKIHVGTVAFGADSMDEVANYVAQRYMNGHGQRREIANKTWDLVHCLALCHSVTPTQEETEDGRLITTYQAVSPDEIAIVNWLAKVGLELVKRDRKQMIIKHVVSGTLLKYKILYSFPFSSDTKRMGTVVQNMENEEEILFLVKGADTVISPIVNANDWLDEEVANMAREGLRTLVVGRKFLTTETLQTFANKYAEASVSMQHDREARMAKVVSSFLENKLDLLGVTGVEDKLQPDIKPSLELLRNAQVKIWMLTGDKVETARCVAVSSRLVSRGQSMHTVTNLNTVFKARQHLDYLSSMGKSVCLLMDGASLQFFLMNVPSEFADVALELSSVVACRCTPQQKADLVNLVKTHSGRRVAAIGDGGNDVSMIQAADIGLGIVGKEGRQASLAADFSVTLFCHITKLLLWHGRNSYKRSAKLAQVVIHRGLIISICQALYSICSKFEPLALFQGWLMVGYATVYTMMPVFSLVTDHDIPAHLTRMYPELYAELKDGRSLSYRSFLAWVFTSLYQGVLIQGLSQLFLGKHSLEDSMFKYLVMVSFSCLILTELLMVAEEIMTWNKIMLVTELVSLALYIGSVPLLPDYFDLTRLTSYKFYVIVTVIVLGAVIPPFIAKTINRRLKPPSYAKVQV